MSKRCKTPSKIPTDDEKIMNAFLQTILELQDNPDPETVKMLEKERKRSEECTCSGG
jgi:hypothetical protein